MIPDSLNQIANHLWQSSMFAGTAWLLTLALRRNPARVRHCVWVAALLKFLLPFSVLIALGSHIQWRTVTTQTNLFVALDQVGQPFTAPATSGSSLKIVPIPVSTLPCVLLTIWAAGLIGFACSWWIRWQGIRSAIRAGSPISLDIPIRAISCPTLVEPGVFGVTRPVLLLPEGFFVRLTADQGKAVIAHELCHVRHKDNLVGTVQMLVETIFWFYPLVWWLGKRVVEERERACDEEVLRIGNEPQIYARGIVTVCRLYLETRVACVAGISGSNLKNRVERILSNRIVQKLTGGKKLLLASFAILVLVTPVVVGTLSSPLVHAQNAPAATPKFEVASIKPNLERTGDFSFDITPGGRVTARNYSVWNLIRTAYGLRELQMSGGPAWIKGRGFDIQAQPAQSDAEVPRDQVNRMLQALLEDRFQLKWHRESRETPVYGLSITARGPKLPPPRDGRGHRMFGDLNVPSMSLDELCQILEFDLDRPVVNQTNLSGAYAIQLQWASERTPAANRADNELRPSLFTAVQEQLGLNLDSIRAKVDVFVIDNVEAPSEN